jgi:pimeloyl-ACP methyl ester carboxylesterase
MTPGWWQKALNTALFFLLMTLPTQTVVKAQETWLPARPITRSNGGVMGQPCDERNGQSAAKDALRLLCLRKAASTDEATVRSAIVIGFVGGFVNHDDARRPEVQFAAFLRDRYPSAVRVEVFANRDGRKALRWLLSQLDANGDGILTAAEKEQTAIIIYGHSWGGSEAVTLARQLDRLGIRVRLTIQVDSVPKLWQSGSRIPANVDRAINFYQSEGLLLHGRSTIRAADPDQTRILGNFRLSYKGHSINCDNYPWLVRVLSKPHHEIENDPGVWDRVGSLIEYELASELTASRTSVVSPRWWKLSGW